MRNLNSINAAAKSTKHAFSISLIIPLVMGFGAWALASGAAPELPLRYNYLEILSLGIIVFAIISFPIPYLFRWNWEAKYFGAGIFPFASGSILGIYPILCIAQYSLLPLPIRLALVLLDGALIIWWCYRFVRSYRLIHENRGLFDYIYEEEPTAVYYLQQADRKVIEKHLKLALFPSAKLTLLPMIIAIAIAPFASVVSRAIGMPFVHVFLAISGLPMSLMFLGFTTRGWLVFYFYPSKIKRETKKRVYVDMSSQPLKSVNPTA